MFQTNKHCT